MTFSNPLPERRLRFAGLVVLIGATGCGAGGPTDGRPTVYPASGSVTLDGRPLAGATVMFQPTEADGKPAHAVTDAAGRYSAHTFEPGDGLTKGVHRVSVIKSAFVDKQGNVVREIREPGDAREVHETPKKYESFETSGIEVRVMPGGNNFDAFKLTTAK